LSPPPRPPPASPAPLPPKPALCRFLSAVATPPRRAGAQPDAVTGARGRGPDRRWLEEVGVELDRPRRSCSHGGSKRLSWPAPELPPPFPYAMSVVSQSVLVARTEIPSPVMDDSHGAPCAGLPPLLLPSELHPSRAHRVASRHPPLVLWRPRAHRAAQGIPSPPAVCAAAAAMACCFCFSTSPMAATLFTTVAAMVFL
jgi:hypothetical protein